MAKDVAVNGGSSPGRSRTLMLALALASTGCAGLFNDAVPRKVHGRVYTGAFIPEEAYAAFLEGALAEQQQAPDRAEQAYLRAVAHDGNHPEPWVRLGALRCAQGAQKTSDDAFARASRLDPEFAPIFRERALCAFRRGDTNEARSLATQALALDPADPEPPLLLARLALAAEQPEEALRWVTALLLHTPRAPGALALLQQHQHHPTLAPLAHRTLAPPSPPGDALAPPSAPWPPRDALVPPGTPGTTSELATTGTGALSLAALDQALLKATPEEARTLARRAGLTPGELASRAAALGLRTLAAEQGRLVLEADPSSTDARIALLAAGNEAEVALALSLPLTTPTAPSAVGALLLAELLLRKSGPEAAQAALRHAPEAREDALATARRTRLQQRLAEPPTSR